MARPKMSARKSKAKTPNTVGGSERAVMPLSLALHQIFWLIEELEDRLRVDHADDPAAFALEMKHLEDMIADIPPVQAQIWEIKQAKVLPLQQQPCNLHAFIWRALPQELTELVLSKLPVKHILALTRSTSTSPCFRRSAAQRHPDLLALMRWNSASVRATVYDPSCNDWTGFDLTGFPTDQGYRNSIYAHDRGLLCFVPASAAPILVCNPLTGDWRTLPMTVEHNPAVAVQLRVDETGAYTVKLVCGVIAVKQLRADCYDSTTGRWTSLETGFVFGACGTLQQFRNKALVVYDCKKRSLLYTSRVCAGQEPLYWTLERDHLVVIHGVCKATELAWDENFKAFSRRRTLSLGPYIYRFKAPHLVFPFATEKFLFVVGDSSAKVDGKSCQLLQVFNRVTQKWRLTSDLGEDREATHPQCLRRAFLCELCWDAVP